MVGLEGNEDKRSRKKKTREIERERKKEERENCGKWFCKLFFSLVLTKEI